MKIMKKAHAGRGPETIWEIPDHMNILEKITMKKQLLSNQAATSVAAAFLFLTSLGVQAGIYDIAADFSTNSNPNGVWSYGYATTLGGTLILYTDTSYSTASVIGWWGDISLEQPSVSYNRSTNVATDGTQNTPIIAPHQAVFHPGPDDEYSIYRFTAPAAGTYQLQVSFAGADPKGTTTDVHVLFNNVSIFDGSVNGFGPGTGPGFSTNLVLQANDRIDFEVGYGNNNFYYDTTAIQATLISSPPLSVNYVSIGQGQVSWPTNFTGFSLESTTNISAASWISVTNSIVTNGQQFTVTLDLASPQEYFRLRK